MLKIIEKHDNYKKHILFLVICALAVFFAKHVDLSALPFFGIVSMMDKAFYDVTLNFLFFIGLIFCLPVMIIGLPFAMFNIPVVPEILLSFYPFVVIALLLPRITQELSWRATITASCVVMIYIIPLENLARQHMDAQMGIGLAAIYGEATLFALLVMVVFNKISIYTKRR